MSSSSSRKPPIVTNQQLLRVLRQLPGDGPSEHRGPYDDCSWRGSCGGRGRKGESVPLDLFCIYRVLLELSFYFFCLHQVTRSRYQSSNEKANTRLNVECVVGTRPTGLLIPSQATGIWIADGPWAGLVACLLFLVPNLSTASSVILPFAQPNLVSLHRHTLTHALQ